MRYDRQTRALMAEITELNDSLDEGVLVKLAQLEKTATALNDDYLLGFTYYYYAYAKHYFVKDRADFTQDLSLAVRYLMRVEDHELLSRVFNLVAIDAFSYGAHDVAYNYYMNARQEARAMGNVLSVAIIETNLALIFMELADYKKAKHYIGNAIRLLYDSRNDPNARYSLMAAYVDDAMISIGQGRLKAARRALKEAEKYIPENATPAEDLRISRTIIALRLAFAENNAKEVQRLERFLIDCFREEPYPADYIGDIRSLCTWLIERGHPAVAGRLIDTVNQKILASDTGHAIRSFSTLKVHYYTACGNDRKVREALEEQQALLHKQRESLNRMRKYTMDLVRLDNDIRTMRRHTKEEHVQLEKKAYHDALTGIANRYMLNKLLEASFERAHKDETLLGIAILDIDYFKEYNDTFGHPAGDRCLVSVASAIEALCEKELPEGASVYAGRYGGDEFVLIYEGMEREKILSLAKGLDRDIRALAIMHPKSAIDKVVTVSQGLCVSVPARKHKVWDFLSGADVALYEVKEARGKKSQIKNGVKCRSIRARDAGERDKYGAL